MYYLKVTHSNGKIGLQTINSEPLLEETNSNGDKIEQISLEEYLKIQNEFQKQRKIKIEKFEKEFELSEKTKNKTVKPNQDIIITDEDLNDIPLLIDEEEEK